MTPTTYGRDFAYCLKSHGGVRGFDASLWRCLLRCTLCCHSVATFLTAVSSYEGGCGFEDHNDSNEYIVKSDIGIRFIAAIIDVLIEAGLSVPAIAFYMLGVAGFTTNSLGYPVHRSLPIFFILSFFAYFIPIIYMLIKDGIGEGQSFGKKIMRIKVIKVNDLSNCTMGVSVIRNLIGIFIVLIPFVGWLIEPIMVLVSSGGRRVADRIAGTMVVNV